MYKGIFSKTFHTQSVDENFALIKKWDYQATQFNFASVGLDSLPDAVPPLNLERIIEAREKYGIKIEAISATFNIIHPDGKVIKHGMQCLDVIAAAAQKLDCKLLTLCSGTLDTEDQWRFHPGNNTPAAWGSMVKSMEQAIGIADKYDVYLGIEPEMANIVNSAAKARALIEQLGSKRIKIIFDPANLFEQATLEEQHGIVSDALDLLKDHIAIAHAKDRNPDGSFATAGKGVLDYYWYLSKLGQAGYTGCIITHGLDEEEAEGVSALLNKYLGNINGA